ncbi:MAG TPA: lipopolysaccharide heptosyltransferase family protein, partial [Methylophaga aminisulfidivorans]|nr:lipopolysaccharide heptosyltransferase family protein [Methylophaga aminisulfidivorans]
QLKLRQKLRDENIDLVIDLQNSNRSSLYQRYFLPNSPWFSRRSSLNGVSGLQGLKQLLEQHQIPITFALKPNVSWMAANVDELLEKANVDKPYIALIPGCSAQHPEKRWPYFSKLSARLVEQGFRVVNVLGPDELSMADDLSGYTPSKDKGILSWFEMAGILKHAQYVIGNDTGPSHVASCLGTPGIALFSEHTSVDRSEIQRDSFLTYQVDELKNLSVDTLLSIITPHLD